MNPSMAYPYNLAHTYLSYPVQSSYTAEQDGVPDSIQSTLNPTLQTQLQNRQFMTRESHAVYLPHSPPALHSHEHNIMEATSDCQTTSTLPMGPPARPRKKKAPTLRAHDWEPYKDRILELHIVQGLSLKEVRDMIEKEAGFSAEIRQYRTRISQWGKDKNIKSEEMRAIVKKRQERKLVDVNKGELIFQVRGHQVEPQKIDRWMKRNNVPKDFLYAPGTVASTPPALYCRTISERGSPAPSLAYSAATPILSPGVINSIAPSPPMLSPGPSNANLVQPHNGTLTRQSPDPIYQSPLNFPLSSAPASDYHGGQLEEWFPLPQNAGMDRHNQAIPVHIGTVTESTMNLNIGQDPPNFQDHGPSIPLLDSQIFLESSNLRSIQSPENQNLYTTPTLPSTTTQAARTNAARFVITDNDLEIDIRAIRQYINSGQEEEGTRIFLDLIGRIHKRVPPEVTSASEVVFRNESLTAETAIARFEATISQRQREYGFEHPLTQGTILSFANFILCLVEDDIRGQDMELLVTGNKLDRAASMLESSLSISFDNDVVRRLVQRDYSKEGLTIEFFEILVTQCAQRPFLLDAIPLSFRYSDLNAEYSIHVTLDIMVMTGELIKEIDDDGEALYSMAGRTSL